MAAAAPSYPAELGGGPARLLYKNLQMLTTMPT